MACGESPRLVEFSSAPSRIPTGRGVLKRAVKDSHGSRSFPTSRQEFPRPAEFSCAPSRIPTACGVFPRAVKDSHGPSRTPTDRRAFPVPCQEFPRAVELSRAPSRIPTGRGVFPRAVKNSYAPWSFPPPTEIVRPQTKRPGSMMAAHPREKAHYGLRRSREETVSSTRTRSGKPRPLPGRLPR